MLVYQLPGTALFAGLAVFILGACADPREKAVEELVAFAEEAPFYVEFGEVDSVLNFTRTNLVVREHALERFNTLFRYFHVPDSARAESYQGLPAVIYETLPITATKSISYRSAGDTLIATIIFERPDYKLFEARWSRSASLADSTDPAKAAHAFTAFHQRLRQELQTIDTAEIGLLPGPQLVTWQTASVRRFMARRDSLATVGKAEVQRDVQGLRIVIDEANLKFVRVLGGHAFGGSIEGRVLAPSAGWSPAREDVYVSTAVQCRASNGTDTLWQEGYISPEERQGKRTGTFLCLWSGDDAEAWGRVKPTDVQVRFVAQVNLDTIAGPWVAIR